MNKIITTEEFHKIKASSGIFIIKISANWCNPCKVLASNINDLPEELRNLFFEVDADEAEEDLIDLLNVRNIPTLILYKNGVEHKRSTGVLSIEDLIKFIND